MNKFYSYLPIFKYFDTQKEYKIKIEESNADWLQDLNGLCGGSGYVLAVGNDKNECEKYIEEHFIKINEGVSFYKVKE